MDRVKPLTEKQWSAVERYLLMPENPDYASIIDHITDGDRDLAKGILQSKKFTGELGMIETALALSRIVAANE
jgi:hypothetical protein